MSIGVLKYPKYLEDIIGFELGDIQAEVAVGRKKVDLYTVSPTRRLPIYVETQIKPSDDLHLATVLGILESISEGVVIWISKKISRRHIQQILSYMKSNRQKYVSFYALEVHPEAIVQADD